MTNKQLREQITEMIHEYACVTLEEWEERYGKKVGIADNILSTIDEAIKEKIIKPHKTGEEKKGEITEPYLDIAEVAYNQALSDIHQLLGGTK